MIQTVAQDQKIRWKALKIIKVRQRMYAERLGLNSNFKAIFDSRVSKIKGGA